MQKSKRCDRAFFTDFRLLARGYHRSLPLLRMNEAVILLRHCRHDPYAPLVGCTRGVELYRCSFGGFVLLNLQHFAETKVRLCPSRGTRKFESSTDESDCRDGEHID